MTVALSLKALRRVLTAVVIVTNVCFCATVFSQFESSRRQKEREVDQTIENLALLLDRNITEKVGYIDHALRAVAAAIQAGLPADATIDPAHIHAVLAQHQPLIAEFGTLRIDDRIEASPAASPQPTVRATPPVHGQDHIALHRARPGHGLVVSNPILEEPSERWIIRFSRRIDHDDGAYAGVVSLSVPVSFFERLFAGLDLGPSDVVTLRDADRALVLRHPPSPDRAARIGAVDVSPMLAEIIASGTTVRTYRTGRDSDGIERAQAYRRLAAMPFHLVVGMASRDYLEPWRSELPKGMALCLIVLVATSGAAWLIVRMCALSEDSALRSRRLSNLYAAISQCGHAIVHSRDETELFRQVCRAAVEFGGLRSAWAGLIDQTTKRVEPVASYGIEIDSLRRLGVTIDVFDRRGWGPTGQCLRENRPFWSQDLLRESIMAPWLDKARTMGILASASLPLCRAGQPVGNLTLYADSTGAFDREVRELLVEMAEDISFALDNFAREAERQRALAEREAAEIALRRAHDFNRKIIDSLPGVFYVFDSAWRILAWNKHAEIQGGWTAEEICNAHPLRFVHPDDRLKAQEAIYASAKNGAVEAEIRLLKKSGDTVHYFFEARSTEVDGVPLNIGLGVDISDLKKAEQRIHELAFFDQLTGLPNRTLLIDRIRQTMAASDRSESYGAVMLIDLDDFKSLNDTLGHDMGDTLLRQVALRLSGLIRSGDTVSRFGGDEFVLILPALSTVQAEAAASIETIGEKVLAVLDQPYLLDEVRYHCTPSIGATLFKGQENSVDDLLRQADLAMYKAKAAGRNTIRFFDPDMQAAVMERVELESELAVAIGQGQLELHYQPQTDGERVIGAEALVRWRHPLRGMVPPNRFIPVAEDSRLILPLGDWVLETACGQLAAWAQDRDFAHLTLAVNVSARQFREPDFVGKVLSTLGRTGCNPHRLKLELTESLLAVNLQDITEKMTALRACGISFSLDDFGTGYSSLTYLKRLPLEQLKIDQSFVRDLLTDANDAAIAQTIVALARSLNLRVIAEGVETPEQREFLARLGCRCYQGYLCSPPLPPDAFEAFLRGLPRPMAAEAALAGD